MPCRDYETDHNVDRSKEKLDEVTRLLCYVMSNHRIMKSKCKESFDLFKWWDNHQKQDRKDRLLASKEARKKALNKLTKEE